MNKVALITGITGQDGSYLAEFLLEKGYKVFGMRRRSSVFNTERIDHMINNSRYDFHLVYGDMTDSLSITKIIDSIKPDEIYNLAAQSHVGVSFETPEYTANVDGLGTLRILEAVRMLNLNKKTKIYQASTSELYGDALEHPQNEHTPFNPVSPYGVAKLYAYWITKCYRDAYDIFACNGILFNHESPRRGFEFVTRKISFAVAKIKMGLQKKLYLGNINSKRDWGHANDYVKAMWLMLQNKKPQDYVIGTGKTYSVKQFVDIAFKRVNLDYKDFVKIDKKLFRPAEVDLLKADFSKAQRELNWRPNISFDELVKSMVDSDIKFIKNNYK